jgi:hypothetical protein
VHISDIFNISNYGKHCKGSFINLLTEQCVQLINISYSNNPKVIFFKLPPILSTIP